MAGKLQAASVASQGPWGHGNCSTTANTWLASRAGPLTGLSVAGFSFLGAPRSRGTVRIARSSSRSDRRRRAARGPAGGMAAWSVGSERWNKSVPSRLLPWTQESGLPAPLPAPFQESRRKASRFPGARIPSLQPFLPQTQES